MTVASRDVPEVGDLVHHTVQTLDDLVNDVMSHNAGVELRSLSPQAGSQQTLTSMSTLNTV